MRVGLISDTHGLVRPQAIDARARAVRGNNDHGPWAEHIPHTETLKAGEVLIYALHDLGG